MDPTRERLGLLFLVLLPDCYHSTWLSTVFSSDTESFSVSAERAKFSTLKECSIAAGTIGYREVTCITLEPEMFPHTSCEFRSMCREESACASLMIMAAFVPHNSQLSQQPTHVAIHFLEHGRVDFGK